MQRIFRSEKISKLKRTAQISYRLLKLLYSIDKKLLIINVIATAIPAIIPFIIAYLFKLIIDHITVVIGGATPDYPLLYMLIAGSFGLYVFQNIAFSTQEYVQRLIYTRVPISLYQIVLSKISSLDVSFYEDSEFRTTLEKVRESYTWRPLSMMDNLLFAFQSLVQIIVALAILSTLNVLLIILVLLVAIPEFINHAKQSEMSWFIWDTHGVNRKKFWYISNLLQSREAVKEMKLFQLPNWFLGDLKNIHEDFYQKNKTLASKNLKINSVFNVLSGFMYISILIYIVMQALSKKITLGDISYFSTATANFQQGIGGLFRNLARLFEESLYVSSMFEILDTNSNIPVLEKAVKVDFKKTPTIEFKNVTFIYPGSKRPVFKNFSLKINPGEKIALVGENGAGKTTLVKLLARFYDVNSGEILIDNINIKDLDLNSWYKTLGVLFQDFIRYEYSAKDNIYFGKVWEKEELGKIVEAAKASGADPVIKRFKKGYDQMLGRTFDEGVDLSGGQWQKIALGRAYFRNAPVLILDEPTSSIDAKAEAEIFDKVEHLSKDKTVIIISHRFSTVRNADKIYVVEHGQIIESGTHQELLKENGQYATLFNLQAKGYI